MLAFCLCLSLSFLFHCAHGLQVSLCLRPVHSCFSGSCPFCFSSANSSLSVITCPHFIPPPFFPQINKSNKACIISCRWLSQSSPLAILTRLVVIHWLSGAGQFVPSSSLRDGQAFWALYTWRTTGHTQPSLPAPPGGAREELQVTSPGSRYNKKWVCNLHFTQQPVWVFLFNYYLFIFHSIWSADSTNKENFYDSLSLFISMYLKFSNFFQLQLSLVTLKLIIISHHLTYLFERMTGKKREKDTDRDSSFIY